MPVRRPAVLREVGSIKRSYHNVVEPPIKRLRIEKDLNDDIDNRISLAGETEAKTNPDHEMRTLQRVLKGQPGPTLCSPSLARGPGRACCPHQGCGDPPWATGRGTRSSSPRQTRQTVPGYHPPVWILLHRKPRSTNCHFPVLGGSSLTYKRRENQKVRYVKL